MTLLQPNDPPGSPTRDRTPEVMVRADALGKCYRLYARPSHRAAEWITRRVRHEPFWALRGVSFDLRRGECLGVIGPNGSGKSTLLKILSGTSNATEGSFSIQGRVLSLIELGTGLNEHLTGRQNIFNAARLLAFPVTYARDTLDEIRDFADLGEFFDRPVRLYSSGMRVRLAFSMFACFRPEVLIVDEALSVGDVFFQQRCAARMRELLGAGMTMLFVSHDMSAVLGLCDRAILLRAGRVEFQGEPEEAVARYYTGLHAKGGKWAAPAEAPASPAPGPAPDPIPSSASRAILDHDVIGARAAQRHGAGGIRILAARVTDASGRDTTAAPLGSTLTFHVLLEARERVARPRAGIQLYDRLGTRVFAAGTFQLGHELPPLDAGRRLVVRLELGLDVSPGDYTFSLSTGQPDDSGSGALFHDHVDLLGPISVTHPKGAPTPFWGIARLPLRARHEPIEPVP